jgi:hypothetical protein
LQGHKEEHPQSVWNEKEGNRQQAGQGTVFEIIQAFLALIGILPFQYVLGGIRDDAVVGRPFDEGDVQRDTDNQRNE